MDGASRVVVEELLDRVLLATTLMLGVGLIGALLMLPINPMLVLLGVGACVITVHSYRLHNQRTEFRIAGLGTCACLYGSFLIAAGQGGDQRLSVALGIGLGALGALVLRTPAPRTF